MLHKIRDCYQFENKGILGCKGGIVEVDETFVGGKNKNRPWKKKVKNSQGRCFKDKTPVLGMLERKGKIVGRVVKNTTAEELTPHILETVSKFATLYTDEWKGYNVVDKIYPRFYVDHGKGQYVNGDVHTNTIEGAWSILKRSIIGVYYQVSKKYLQKYVDEFVFHYNYRNLTEQEKSDIVINNAKLKHSLTHKKLAA
jgi:transposase-like protein